MGNEAKNENLINWLHEALPEAHNKPCKKEKKKKKGKKCPFLTSLISISTNRKEYLKPNFQPGVGQNFNMTLLKIKEFRTQAKQDGEKIMAIKVFPIPLRLRKRISKWYLLFN